MFCPINLPIAFASLDSIADEMVGSVDATVKSGIDMVMQIVNSAVVPILLLVLFISMLFCLAMFAYTKKQREGEGANRYMIGFVVSFIIFFVVASYAVAFSGLIKQITG